MYSLPEAYPKPNATHMMPVVEQVARSSKGCWTCKRRKIGCDKSLPSCSNCIRTKRKCDGYGVKLTWPDDGDGRRPYSITSNDVEHFFLSSTSSRGGPAYFLNTSDQDLISDARKPLPIPISAIYRCNSTQSTPFTTGPAKSLSFGYENTLKDQESSLLSYYTDILSRMITTIDDSNNGFRTLLVPVALSENTSASLGLRQAVFALSAYHLWGHDAAVKYKLSAIRHISTSLQNGEDAALPQLAASMMMCIGDVFDSADGSWSTHLAAAKAIGGTLIEAGDLSKDLFFLQTLLEYHDVLGGFSSGKRLKQGQRAICAPETANMPEQTSEDTVIIGALGCSRELMNIIALITRLNSITPPLPDRYRTLSLAIQKRLDTLTQDPVFRPDAQSSQLDTARILKTAELYRLATIIYLHTTLIPLPRSSVRLQTLLSQSLDLLESFRVCTSPWPLFVTALEVNNDLDRVRVLGVLDIMQKVRRIGNVNVLQGIVEEVWKRIDLSCDTGENCDERLDWRDFFDMSGRLPSFI